MDTETSRMVTLFALWAVNLIGGGFILAHIVRSIWLKKGLSRDTMKMYLGALFMVVLADLAIAKTLPPEVVAGFLGAVIGGTIGARASDKEDV